jgi:hypothetical protein
MWSIAFGDTYGYVLSFFSHNYHVSLHEVTVDPDPERRKENEVGEGVYSAWPVPVENQEGSRFVVR